MPLPVWIAGVCLCAFWILVCLLRAATVSPSLDTIFTPAQCYAQMNHWLATGLVYSNTDQLTAMCNENPRAAVKFVGAEFRSVALKAAVAGPLAILGALGAIHTAITAMRSD